MALWPVHPQIQPGELLSSWMIRLAHANGFKVHSFYALFFGKQRQIWTRDIDHHAPAWLLDGLAERSGTEKQRLAKATLRSYESYAFEHFNEVGPTRWILPLGVFHRARKRFGLQFCSECLNADATPYLRLQWRLALSTVCVHHQTLLKDRCTECGHPLMPHRADLGNRRTSIGHLSLTQCTFCRASLIGTSRCASNAEVALQSRIDDALTNGFAFIDKEPVYSHLYFDGLRFLMGGLARLGLLHRTSQDFAFLPPAARLERLFAADQVLASWPRKILEICDGAKQPYSAFTRTNGAVPFWLDNVLRRHLISRHSPVSKQEANAIAAALEGRGEVLTTTKLRQLSGRDIGRWIRRDGVSEEVADMLIAALDQRYSDASTTARLLLLRDKVMFIAGRQLHLSIPDLLSMQVRDFDRFEEPRFSFWDGVRGKEHAYEMLAWYARLVRPGLVGQRASQAMFLTAAGLPMGLSAVGMRFTSARCQGHLHREIANWGQWAARATPNTSVDNLQS